MRLDDLADDIQPEAKPSPEVSVFVVMARFEKSGQCTGRNGSPRTSLWTAIVVSRWS